MKDRYLVSKSFEFNDHTNVTHKIEVGELISYEVYSDCNMTITVYCRSGTIEIYGHEKNIEDYIRAITYDDLKHPKEYIFEQQKDRTYRHGVTKKYAFVDNLDQVVEEGKDEEYAQAKQDKANYNKRIDTAAVLNYLKKAEKANYDTPGKPLFDKSIANWISHQIAVKQKELERLDILTATDEDIIQTALMEYGNQECYSNDVEIANKITDVRNRYLEMIYPKEEGEE